MNNQLNRHLKKPSEPTQVRFTGDWSGDSKLSSIQNGYWDDPFFIQFNLPLETTKIPKRTALICRGYFVRFKLCDYFLKQIIHSIDTPLQILSLGCGMDTAYFRLVSDSNYSQRISKFFELDFSSVIKRKRDIITCNQDLQQLAENKLFLIEADLRNLNTLSEILQTSGFNFDKPTLFYSECVVNYLKPKESDAILHWITSHLKQCVWLAYEQCYPNDDFGKLMVQHFQKNGCPIHSIESYGDIPSQTLQLETAKFNLSLVLNVWDCFTELVKNNRFKFPEVHESQQFDEYEAFLATCLHYSIRLGSSIPLKQIPLDKTKFKSEQISFTKFPSHNTFICDVKSTFSTHCSIMLDSDTIWLFGGTNKFGKRPSNITSLKYILNEEVNRFALEESTLNPNLENQDEIFERIHSAAVFIDSINCIFIFGGRKSPRAPCTQELIRIRLNREKGGIVSIEQINHLKHSSSPQCQSSNHSFPCARWRHSLTHFVQKDGSVCLFLFGGKTEKETRSDYWIYNCNTNIWCQSSYSGPQPSPRHSQSICTDWKRKSICLVGGMLSDSVLCSDACWQYDYSSGIWVSHPEFNKYTRKVGSYLLIHEDDLIILGGYGNDSKFHLQHFLTIINLETNDARHFELVSIGEVKIRPCPIFKPILRMTRNSMFFDFLNTCSISKQTLPSLFLPFGFSVHLTHLGQQKSKYIIILGGGGNCFSFGSHYNDKTLLLKLPVSN